MNSTPKLSKLLAIAKKLVIVSFLDQTGRAFADVCLGDLAETLPIESTRFRDLLRAHMKRHKLAVGTAQLTAVQDHIAGDARLSGITHEMRVRVAGNLSTVYVDLADSDGWIVEVSAATGIKLVTSAPVRFYRAATQKPLPLPVPNGNPEVLRTFFNLQGEDFDLFAAYLAFLFCPIGPHPVGVVLGPQGSTKSTFCRCTQGIVDPSRAGPRTPPKDAKDVMIASRASWLLVYDNLSELKGWLSDLLCMLCTGASHTCRELYTNEGEHLLEAQLPVMLNGIVDFVKAPDLLDRCITFTLYPMSDDVRVPAADLMDNFNRSLPEILDVVLNRLLYAMQNYPRTSPTGYPRIEGFARFLTALDGCQHPSDSRLVGLYLQNRRAAVATILDGHPVAEGLKRMLADQDNWSGTATELLKELRKFADPYIGALGLPASPDSLGSALKRLQPNLKSVGISVVLGGRSAEKRLIYISRQPICRTEEHQ